MFEGIMSKVDPEIDYIGQEFSERLMLLILSVGYAISLAVGLFKVDLTYTLHLGIAANVVCFILTVPSWPYFRRNALRFKTHVKPKSD